MKRLNLFTEKTKYWKGLVTFLAALVVFVTTYALILPAITLDEETAGAQGGIDVTAGQDIDAADPSDAADDGTVPDATGDEDISEPADVPDGDDADMPEEDADADVSDVPENVDAAGADSGPVTIGASDETYNIEVTYDESAGIPDDAELAVEEITDEADEYDEYMERTEEALGKDRVVAFARFFDIKIMSGDEEIQPLNNVDVRIEIPEILKAKDAEAIHFGTPENEGDEVEDIVLDSEIKKAPDGTEVSFSTDGFSTYAIVDGPDVVANIGWTTVGSMEEFIAKCEQGLYVGHPGGYYFTNETVYTPNNRRTGIKKTTPAQPSGPPEDAAVIYYFEPAPGGNNQFYAYCMDGNNRKYVYNGGNNSLSFTDEGNRTAFTVEYDEEDGYFQISHDSGNKTWYWNMQGGVQGTRFCSYDVPNNENNMMYFWYSADVPSDPYDLDGKTYGFMNWNGGAAGKAVMGEASNGNLKAELMTVMTKYDDDTSKLFVTKDSDMTRWTFRWVSGDKYYLEAETDDGVKYLKMDESGLSLVDSQEDAGLIKVVPGTGAHKGQICLKSGSIQMTYSGDMDTGFNTGGSAGSEWLYLTDFSELPDDYVRTYTAKKVSVSDTTQVQDGAQIIIYTRAWNEEEKKYEFYAIDKNGNLIPCTESGDYIEWRDGILNELLWDFTEYTYDDGTPNGYYELHSEFSEQYIAPQLAHGDTEEQILSGSTIGLNLTGRTDGRYATPILAWDDANYVYAGLKVAETINEETGEKEMKIVACPKLEAMDFYFAIVQEVSPGDKFTYVDTVDNNQYGITMKIKDFDTREQMGAFIGSNAGTTGSPPTQGLLSSSLIYGEGEDADSGYPTAAGGSLKEFFAGETEVNHLFIESTYNASGYFEFDSTQNYASLLDEDGHLTTDFRVYKEIASYDTGGNRPTLKHGQFFPLNDIEPGVFATTNGKNLYDVFGNGLPDSDPRKNEQLYLIKNANCQYGIELEATFVQTPNGTDDWGHDIIYEFTGDDDFWLYVNGELVIDLGGIHSALEGTVNFSTGDVVVNGEHSTLREIFESNYRGRNSDASDGEVAAYLAQYFDEGSTVFRPLSTNTMRIFYLERGGGAANLHMRFNLASIKPGTVEFSKQLDGIDPTESSLAVFPYQINYTVKDEHGAVVMDGDHPKVYTLRNKVPDDLTNYPVDHVFYKDTITPVTFKPSLTIGGVEYQDVFMLNPEEIAEADFTTLNFEEEFGEEMKDYTVYEYSIVECGVNTDVFEDVLVNDDSFITDTGREGSTTYDPIITSHGDKYKDYGLSYKPTSERARVAYTNVVDPDALCTLTFDTKLFKEDGVAEIHDDPTVFSFRLHLGPGDQLGENESPPLANMQTYHVKNADGVYCRWDSDSQGFVALDGNPTSYDDLSNEEKIQATFNTSMTGAISKIPVDHTVEVRAVLAGTKFGVVERPREVPDGYSFQKYKYDENAKDGLDPVDNPGTSIGTVKGVVDTTVEGQDPHVDICNLKGWGLRINKVWTDQSYVSDRAPTYFAVFKKAEETNTLNLVPDTVRKMTFAADPSSQSLYWYFPMLPQGGTLDDYEIREVTIEEENPVIDDDGIVTNPGEVTIVKEGDELELSGKLKGESDSAGFTYTVHYEKGAPQDNVREDEATNSRPGIVIKKTKWDGQPLSDATFTLNRGDDSIGTFTSDEEGNVTIAYLGEGVTYTLTETGTPQLYHGLQDSMTLEYNDGTLAVSGVASENYVLESGDDGTTLTIKNRPYTFRAIKKDNSGHPIGNVTFTLFKKKIVGGYASFVEVDGCGELTTDQGGLIPNVDDSLTPGTYELRENTAPAGYETLSVRVRFTISETGAISLDNTPEGVELTDNVDNETTGNIAYELIVVNPEYKHISFMKVDAGNTSKPLSGAVFNLCKDADGTQVLYAGLTSNASGMLLYQAGSNDPVSVFDLPSGKYYLFETQPPGGYEARETPVEITITREIDDTDVDFDEGTLLKGVSYDDGTIYSVSGQGRKYEVDSDRYTLRITNTSGAILPSTGGPGTAMFYILGAVIMILAGAGLIVMKRRRRRGA